LHLLCVAQLLFAFDLGYVESRPTMVSRNGLREIWSSYMVAQGNWVCSFTSIHSSLPMWMD